MKMYTVVHCMVITLLITQLIVHDLLIWYPWSHGICLIMLLSLSLSVSFSGTLNTIDQFINELCVSYDQLNAYIFVKH